VNRVEVEDASPVRTASVESAKQAGRWNARNATRAKRRVATVTLPELYRRKVSYSPAKSNALIVEVRVDLLAGVVKEVGAPTVQPVKAREEF
jgi:hypothetical protein